MYVDTKETAFLHDLTKPSLEALSHVLRHQEMWPENFHWDYSQCHTCAMGLAALLWSQIESGDCLVDYPDMARAFSMPCYEARNIFYGDHWAPRHKDGLHNVNHDAVTPHMVADEIDKYLASRKG